MVLYQETILLITISLKIKTHPTTKNLKSYFESKSWYEGTIEPEDFDDSVFNEYEIANRDLIVEYEKEKGYR